MNSNFTKFTFEIEEHDEYQKCLVFKLDESQNEHLCQWIEHVLQSNRLCYSVLSVNWKLNWKVEAIKSKVLLAHPEKDDWVATVSLTKSDFEDWLQSLKQKKSFFVNDFAALGFPSNLTFRFNY